MSERGEALSSDRENKLLEIIFMFSAFIATIGAHSISKEVAWFFLYGFPEEKLFVSLVSCDYSFAYYSLR